MRKSASALAFVSRQNISPIPLAHPIIGLRRHAATKAAQAFVSQFPGRTLYAVKANPSVDLLKTLFAAGITDYDVASIAEVRLVRKTLPSANLFYMHPIKPMESIAEAYFTHGVRAFSLDSQEELDKICAATNHAQDLTLCVRLAVSSAHAKLSLAAKFGATVEEAPALLLATRQIADSLGICFHVGSQAMSPQAYSDALERVRSVIVKAGVTVDVIDVGGGFPSAYPGMEPPALTSYFDVIAKSFESLPVSYSAELWCEPGRALSAEYASLIVRVEKRRGDVLFINDGAYGSLFDAAHVGWRYPVKLLRASDVKPLDFSFYGPTCDDMDFMAGPFSLPADIQSGDYIEVGMIGAYGQVMKTNFNGFGATETVLLADAPMLTLYDGVIPTTITPVAKAE
jgi:ornithine decarboxylase